MSKLYEKRVWYNNQTKLSAKNMNHIEDGIQAVADKVEYLEEHGIDIASLDLHYHDNLDILDQTNAAFTSEWQTLIEDTIGAKSEVSVSAEGTSEESAQYITIDGVEYKLASTATKYQELDGASLNLITEEGLYKLTNALDVPVNTSANGFLNVVALDDGQTAQEWLSTTNRAFRVFNDETVGLRFFVNGEIVPQGEVYLPAGDVYELSGDLAGHITIGQGELVVNNRTKVILNGVNIQSDIEYAIKYTPDAGKLVVEVVDNSSNYLVVTNGLEEIAALHSENNLLVNGAGYLTIKNTAGHGIKGSELVINGNIHMYLDTYHDAIHGGKLLKISGGYFEVENANDAFSASEGKNNDAKLLIMGGEYVVHNCKESAFEGKSSNGIKRIINSKITLGEGVTTAFHASNAASTEFEIKIYDGLNEIINEYGKTIPALTDIRTAFGAPRILLDGENAIDMTETELILSPASDTEYTLIGDFTGKRVITRPASGVKVDFIVKDFYYGTDPNLDPEVQSILDANPFWEHDCDKRIKFSPAENYLMYIDKPTVAGISTSRNIQVKGKGDLFIKCAAGEAISAPDGYTVLGGDGIRSLTGSVSGISTASLRLGEDPDDIDEKFSDQPSKRGASEGPVYIYGNDAFDVKITETDTLLTYKYQIIATQYFTGVALLGSIQRESTETKLVVNDALVLQKEGLPYQNSALVFAQASSLDVEGQVWPLIEIEGVNDIIPELDITGTADWIIYKGAYTKEEIDAKFVAKTTYDALVTELNDRAPKKITITNYVEDASKDDHRPAKDHAYCPVEYEDDGETLTKYVADSIEVYRYACPERIDIDDVPETHGDYIKDGRPIYARDGDFGYPEIDKTGQFNFKPVWNEEGYVIVPEGITPADGYKNFKTQWNIGIPGMYRLTKVNSDLELALHAVKEADMPAHTITYKIIAPADYPVENLPAISYFRGADHIEKYLKYGPGATVQGAYNTLDSTLIDSCHLALPELYDTVTENSVDYNVWTILDKAYDDANGLPSADTTGDVAKVYFRVEGTPAENYAYKISAKKVSNNFNKLNNPTAEKPYYTLTKVAGNIEVTVEVVVDVADVNLTFVNYTSYSVEDTITKAVITEPLIINGLQDYQFKVNHQLGDSGAHGAIITSVTIDGVEGTILQTSDLEGADAAVVWKASNKKDECRIKRAYIPTVKGTEHNIIITIGTEPTEN